MWEQSRRCGRSSERHPSGLENQAVESDDHSDFTYLSYHGGPTGQEPASPKRQMDSCNRNDNGVLQNIPVMARRHIRNSRRKSGIRNFPRQPAAQAALSRERKSHATLHQPFCAVSYAPSAGASSGIDALAKPDIVAVRIPRTARQWLKT